MTIALETTQPIAVRRIMLIDDDPFVRDVALTALSVVPGVTVQAWSSGAEALAALEGFAPELILLDVVMPGMDGYATWAHVAKRSGKPPRLIFLTGRDDDDTRDKAVALGAAGVIVKPFNPAAFAAAVLGVAHAAATREAKVDAVAQSFAASLPATCGMIAAAWEAMADAWNADAAEVLLAAVHRIAGVAAMFRFHQLGEAADRAEGLLRTALAQSGRRDCAEHAGLESAVMAVIEEGRKAAGITSNEATLSRVV